MTRLTFTEAQADFAEIVSRAANAKERTIVSRQGNDLAAVIPIEDLHLLESLIWAEETRQDLEGARAALAEPGENITLEAIKEELGL